jgi:hypothetical protein
MDGKRRRDTGGAGGRIEKQFASFASFPVDQLKKSPDGIKTNAFDSDWQLAQLANRQNFIS